MVIKTIGKHRVKHGDIMDGIDDLMDGKQADIIYTDPPWGQGNIRYWQTLNKKMTGAERKEIKYDAFINQIFKVCKKYAKNLLFVEYGIQWKDDIINLGEKYGFIHNQIIDVRYRSGSKLLPLHLHVFSKTSLDLSQDYIDSVTNTHRYKTLKKALMPFSKEGMTILDPCCGMGFTAGIAKQTGMTFYGNELNSKRLEKTIKRLEK
tara:strand:- start:1900 stop:2517 length:618 start_codon:yes stop_codon:yes gene_type:complete